MTDRDVEVFGPVTYSIDDLARSLVDVRERWTALAGEALFAWAGMDGLEAVEELQSILPI